MASTENSQSPTNYRRLHEPIDLSCIEPLHKDDIQLVWIDRHCKNDDLAPLLYKIDPSSQFFDNLTSAIEYLSNNKDLLQFFVIVSGEFCKEVIQLSEHMPQIYLLFIYCSNVENYRDVKDKSLKLSAICDKRLDLINSIEKAQKSASIAIARQYSMRDLSKESATFIWFQLLKSLLAKLINDNEETAKNDLKQQIIDSYHDKKVNNKKQRLENFLNELESYSSNDAISWYTRPAFISDIINEALRRQDIKLLYKCRLFIRDLSQKLTELQQKLPTRVYRGTVLSRENFNKLKYVANQRNFISMFGYLSTSKDRNVAKFFGDKPNNGTDESFVSVIYEIDIDNDTNIIAADIYQQSECDDEEEILFDIDSVFEVLGTKFDEKEQLYSIHMRTSSYGNQLAKEYLQYNQTELNRLNVELLFGRLITDMGEFDQSINYFERLIDKEHIDQTYVRINLGRAYALQGDFENAYRYFYAAKQLETNENPLKTAEILSSFGWLDNALGNHILAIEKYQKALELYDANQDSGHWQIKGDLHTNIAMAQIVLSHFDEARQELDSTHECMKNAKLPPNHPDFAQHQVNHGKVCQRRGDYPRAKEYYTNALNMRRRALPPGHLDIGKVLFNLGSATGEEGNDYDKALTYFRESLVITENAVGEKHPTTILVRSGIANVYQCQDDHEQALKQQLKVLELYENIYDNKDHEDIARTLNNIGEIFRRMKDYEKALFYLNKALKMRRTILGDNHYDTGTTLINLAEVYRDMKDYKKALQYAESGIKLWRQKMLPTATYVSEGEELLIELNRLISENDSINRNDI